MQDVGAKALSSRPSWHSNLLTWCTLTGFALIPLSFSSRLQDNYTVAKWLVFYLLSSLSTMATIFRTGELRTPRIFFFKLSWLISAVIFLFLSVLLNSKGPLQNQMLDWLCFFVTALATFNAVQINSGHFKKLIVRFTLTGMFFVLSYSMLQKFSIEPMPWLAREPYPVSFFGNRNMLGEYLGISILILIFCFKNLKYSWFTSAIAIGAGLYLIITIFNRGSLLALAVSAGLTLAFSKIRTKRNLIFILLISGVTALAGGALFLSTLNQPRYERVWQSSEKMRSVELRGIRWMNTLYLIRDNPLGIGPGNYEFKYVLYRNSFKADIESREDLMVRSPHNGYLEMAAEFGLPFFILFCAGALFFLYRLWEALKSPTLTSTQKSLLKASLAILLFVAIVAMFSFPMENAFPFYACAIALGISFHFIGKSAFSFKYGKTLLGLILFLVIFQTARLALSKFYEDSRSNTATERACRVFPSNWQACMNTAVNFYEAGEFNRAYPYLTEILKKFPNNYPALRLKGWVAMELGKKQEACNDWKIYDQWFEGNSSVHSALVQWCGLKKSPR